MASKTCHAASLQSVFREVHHAVRDRKTLRCDVDALVKVLSSVDSAHHVRHLGIKGFLHQNIDECNEVGKEERTWADDGWFQLRGVAEVLGEEEPYLGGDFYPDEAVEVSPEEDAAWAPVFRLVKTIPHLTKLVYDCRCDGINTLISLPFLPEDNQLVRNQIRSQVGT